MGNIVNFISGLPAVDRFDTEVFGYFLVAYFATVLLASASSVVIYVLQSLGLFTIARRRGIRNPWLAWIPVANMWTLGSISDQYQYVVKGKIRNRRKTLVGLNIALIALMITFFICYIVFFVSLMGSVVADWDMLVPLLVTMGVYIALFAVAVILTVFQYIVTYDLFASCKPDNAVAFLVLSIFFNFLLPFFIFACRKKDLGMPPRKVQIPQQPAAPEEPEPQPEIIDALPEASEESTEE